MNTVSKILAATAAATVLPLAAFASIDDTNNPYAASGNAAITAAPANNVNLTRTELNAPATGTLTNSDLTGALVVSQDRQLVGSVVSVFEGANGDLVASVAPASRIQTSANRTLIPVSDVTTDGNVQLNADFEDVRSALIGEYGYAPQD